MNDPFAMLGQPQTGLSPYIVIAIDMQVCKIHDQYINGGVAGARKLATNLKKKVREANDLLLHPNLPVHVELIADETTWKDLFLTRQNFIDGFNGDNNCRVSYHKNFGKLAEELLRCHLGDTICKRAYLACGTQYGVLQIKERFLGLPGCTDRLTSVGATPQRKNKKINTTSAGDIDTTDLWSTNKALDGELESHDSASWTHVGATRNEEEEVV